MKSPVPEEELNLRPFAQSTAPPFGANPCPIGGETVNPPVLQRPAVVIPVINALPSPKLQQKRMQFSRPSRLGCPNFHQALRADALSRRGLLKAGVEFSRSDLRKSAPSAASAFVFVPGRPAPSV